MKTVKKKKLEIKPAANNQNGRKKYELYTDDRLVYEHGYDWEGMIVFDGGSAMTVKKDLNFDASHVVDKLDLHVPNPEGGWDYRVMFYLARNGNKIKMSYFISFDPEEVLEMDINPIKLLKLFLESAEKKKYIKTSFIADGLEVIGVGIETTVPARGNIYEYYKKHTTDFEKLFKKAGSQLGDNNQSLTRVSRRIRNAKKK